MSRWRSSTSANLSPGALCEPVDLIRREAVGYRGAEIRNAGDVVEPTRAAE
jgi:hypothetical protein